MDEFLGTHRWDALGDSDLPPARAPRVLDVLYDDDLSLELLADEDEDEEETP